MTKDQVIEFARQVENFAEKVAADAHALMLLAQQLQTVHTPQEESNGPPRAR